MWLSSRLLLLLLAMKWTWAQQIVPCLDSAYVDCHHYCRHNCIHRGVDCVHHCNNGCGCVEAVVLRNNGGCMALIECLFDESSNEEPDVTPTPCTDTIELVENENGDHRLNLWEYVPLDPKG